METEMPIDVYNLSVPKELLENDPRFRNYVNGVKLFNSIERMLVNTEREDLLKKFHYIKEGQPMLTAFYNRLIKDNMCICHKCDNPSCVNPHHLSEGTQQDNSNDMVNKGRAAKGEKQHLSKLTEKQVLEIRAKYAKGGTTHRQLAKEYGVFHAVIGNIIRRKTWTHN